jgi:hypothetical protein
MMHSHARLALRTVHGTAIMVHMTYFPRMATTTDTSSNGVHPIRDRRWYLHCITGGVLP